MSSSYITHLNRIKKTFSPPFSVLSFRSKKRDAVTFTTNFMVKKKKKKKKTILTVIYSVNNNLTRIRLTSRHSFSCFKFYFFEILSRFKTDVGVEK